MNFISKMSLIGILFFVGATLKAATVNINEGETVTINANETSTVSCGNGGSGCADATANLKNELDACSNGNNSPGASWCVQTIWSPWRNDNPKCVSSGASVCAVSCINASTTPGTAWCVQSCR